MPRRQVLSCLRGRLRWAALRRDRRWGLVMAGGAPVVIVLMVLPGVLAFPALNAPFALGCAGPRVGTQVVVNSGTTTGGVFSYSNTSGQSNGALSAASAAGGSHIRAGAYYFVGPAPTGCSSFSGAPRVGLTATWNWSLIVTPLLMVNCSNNASFAETNYTAFTLGNIQNTTARTYLWSPDLKSLPVPFSHALSCSGTGSSVYSPGPLGPKLVSITSPVFTLPGGTFDFYASVWGDAAAGSFGAASSYAAVQVNATLTQVSCPGCP
jgi:hypothetical protein